MTIEELKLLIELRIAQLEKEMNQTKILSEPNSYFRPMHRQHELIMLLDSLNGGKAFQKIIK